MEINKTEGVYQDIVVIHYNSQWYGIPFGQIVQMESAQKKYGMNVTISKLIDEGLVADQREATVADEAVADMAVEFGNRVSQLTSNFLTGFKKMLDDNPSEWAAILVSSLIP
jgi:hypothetical protein